MGARLRTCHPFLVGHAGHAYICNRGAQRTVGVSVPRADGVRVDLRWNLCDSRFRGAPARVATSQPRLSTLMRSRRATRGLGIARPPVINEGPRAIGGPLERCLRSSDETLRQLGSATVVVSNRRRIGKRYFIDHGGTPDGVAQRSHVLRHSIGTGKTTGRATSVPLRLRQFTTIYSRPLFRVCSRLHSREMTLAISERELTVPSQ
jgi:hypothetical protein